VAGEPRKEKLKSDGYGTSREAPQRGNLERERERLLGRGEFVRQLLANFPNGSVNVFDRDLRYLLAEGRGLEEEGLTPEMLVGKTIEELFPKESADVVGPFYQRAFAGENVEFELALGDRTYGIFAAPLREENGEVRTIIAVAQDVTERKRVQAERERLLARQQKARAAEEERKRISRELHDRVAHTMVLVTQSLQLYEAYRERDPEKAAEKLELAKRMSDEALKDTKDLSRALRASEREEGELWLEAALSELIRDAVPPEMERKLSVVGDEGAVSDGVREQLFLVLREAVRNTVSHSGASKLSVGIRTGRERIVGVVEDDGRGFDRKAPERAEAGGLTYMAERASLMGGSCSIESAPGEGTRVETSFPLDSAKRLTR
jgi:PAS domain S-box-containing protein